MRAYLLMIQDYKCDSSVSPFIRGVFSRKSMYDTFLCKSAFTLFPFLIFVSPVAYDQMGLGAIPPEIYSLVGDKADLTGEIGLSGDNQARLLLRVHMAYFDA